MIEPPNYSDIVEASQRISKHARRTPLLRSDALDELVGGNILIKPECLQCIGAFKFRGAYNAISRINQREFPGGVVAGSSGNHAQGVAEAARLLGLPSAIVMPSDAPRIKVRGVKRAGGEVIAYERDSADRDDLAQHIAGERRAAMVHPFDDRWVIAGQGTVGKELMEQSKLLDLTPDAILAPIGGGGLISGVALAAKHHHPDTEVYGIEPEGFDDFRRSLDVGTRLENPPGPSSICDALLSPKPGVITFQICQRVLSGGLTVSDDDVRDAMKFAFERLKLVLEPGGAVALAALLNGSFPVRGGTVAVVLSGGNVDPDAYATAIGAH